MRSRTLILSCLIVLTAMVGMFLLSFQYFQFEEQDKASGRLSLYRSTVVAELERFSHLTYVLARDPFVQATATGGQTQDLNQRLATFAEQSNLDAIYLMTLDGETISASNADTPSSFVGQNYGFRPYFRDAIKGEQGRFYGIGATTGLPGYFIADGVRDGSGQLSAVVAIKLDLSKLEQSWRDAGETVLLTNDDGVILLSSNADWRYRTLDKLTAEARLRIDATKQFQGQPLNPLDWRETSSTTAVIKGAEHIHLTAIDLPHDWQLHYFADQTPVRTRAWLITGLLTMIAATVLIVTQARHSRRIGVALMRSEAEEAQLREANERLAIEIEDRRTAERRLARTQDQLERASRLAALGQLSASVTHELGQPIAAMRNHLAAAEMSDAGPKRLMPRIADLVDRMEGITRQLKFFARSGGDSFEPVDLREAMRASLSLLSSNIKATETTLEIDQPDTAIVVFGNQLRLEQVMTNLLRNAVDAMEEEDNRKLTVQIGQSHDMGWFRIEDSGHGLGDATLSDLQEPFVTSRESGHGMGLGLAISANIVAEHNGHIAARNTRRGGAVFDVKIPLITQEDRQAAE